MRSISSWCWQSQLLIQTQPLHCLVLIRNNSYLCSSIPCDILEDLVESLHGGHDRDSVRRFPNSRTVLPKHNHIYNWNGSGNTGEIKDYSLSSTISTLFFYSVEKVV